MATSNYSFALYTTRSDFFLSIISMLMHGGKIEKWPKAPLAVTYYDEYRRWAMTHVNLPDHTTNNGGETLNEQEIIDYVVTTLNHESIHAAIAETYPTHPEWIVMAMNGDEC